MRARHLSKEYSEKLLAVSGGWCFCYWQKRWRFGKVGWRYFVGFLLAWAWAVTFRGGEIFRGFLLAWGASLEVGRESEGENFRGGDFFFGEYGF